MTTQARRNFPQLRRQRAVAHAPAEVGEEDTAMILYTSGTTGRPKGAMLAHCNVIHSAMVFVSCLQLTAADRSIAAVPLAHVTGVVANIMTMVRCAGSADHHGRVQGRGISEESRRANASPTR